MWPAFVMDEAHAKSCVGLEPATREGSIPVQFFGSYDYARINSKQAIPFSRGFQSNFQFKCKRMPFVRGLDEAWSISSAKISKRHIFFSKSCRQIPLQLETREDNCHDSENALALIDRRVEDRQPPRVLVQCHRENGEIHEAIMSCECHLTYTIIDFTSESPVQLSAITSGCGHDGFWLLLLMTEFFGKHKFILIGGFVLQHQDQVYMTLTNAGLSLCCVCMCNDVWYLKERKLPEEMANLHIDVVKSGCQIDNEKELELSDADEDCMGDERSEKVKKSVECLFSCPIVIAGLRVLSLDVLQQLSLIKTE
eukprot:Gb_04716 [translate_table: standard]